MLESSKEIKQKISKLIYLVPIILGTIGALIGYFYTKNRDKELAKNILLVGIVSNLLTPIGGLVVYLIYYRKK